MKTKLGKLAFTAVTICLGVTAFASVGSTASKEDYDRAVALAKTDPAAAVIAAKKAIEEDPDFTLHTTSIRTSPDKSR